MIITHDTHFSLMYCARLQKRNREGAFGFFVCFFCVHAPEMSASVGVFLILTLPREMQTRDRQSFLHSFHPILLSTFSTLRLIPSLLSTQTVSGCVVCYVKLEKEPHSNTNKQRCDVRASRSSTEVVQHDTIRRHCTAKRERWCYFTSVLGYWREDITVYDLTTDEFFSVTERRVVLWLQLCVAIL